MRGWHLYLFIALLGLCVGTLWFAVFSDRSPPAMCISPDDEYCE